MKKSNYLWGALATSILTVGASVSAEEFQLKLKSEGVAGKTLNGYMPTHISLTNVAPAGIKKAPADLVAPLYGTLKLGPAAEQSSLGVILDEPETGPARLFVDVNGDGNYQNDPAAKWEAKTTPGANGKTTTMYNGDGAVNVKFGKETLPLHLKFYRFDKNDPARASLKTELFYYRDYAQEGDVTLDGKSYHVVLDDIANHGAFEPKAGEKSSGVRLWIDVNGDGKYDSAFEGWDINEPFNIKGHSFIASVSGPSGGKLKVETSQVAADERKTQFVGDKALVFEAKTTQDKSVSFPADYKGKLVMLDFWATWCTPCVGEMPNLSAVYKEYHSKGFEVLGVSLDDKKPAKEIEDFATGKGLTWNQIYEGGQWNTRLAKFFTVRSIPHTLLVDGDTGMILATDNELRGKALAPTLDKQLAAKKSK